MPDASDYLALALDLADAAAVAVRPHFRTRIATDDKDDASPVTRADRAAEEAMRAMLAQACPGHGIIGEEFGATAAGSGGLCWVLDPIDGTRAFITGRTTFGTLIALLRDETPVIGIIDQPVTGERWVGVAGRPTEFSGSFGGSIGCRPCASIGAAELSCTSPDIFAPAEAARFARLRQSVRRTSWGGDCYAFGLLALGEIDLIVETDLKPWDWAALVPIITGAGGSITDWQGAPLTLAGAGQVIALGDPSLLPAVIDRLA